MADHEAGQQLLSLLSSEQLRIFTGARAHSETLLNCSPRFKWFTLHGTTHINNLLRITDVLISGGVSLRQEEAFLYSIALCIHDLGMVVGLRERDITALLGGQQAAPDPAILESYIRDVHHQMVDNYVRENSDFLLKLGLTPNQLGQCTDIARCHRKVVLESQSGFIKYLGALLRLIDELDISAERAPAAVVINQRQEMDSTSCWHWVKHNIVEAWVPEHTVNFSTRNGKRRIEFRLAVRPCKEGSIKYWLNQIRRPITRVLVDDGCARILRDRFDVEIDLVPDEAMSKPVDVSGSWAEVEEKALTGGRKVILLIDDEVRKMEDLMLPLTLDYHVLYASSASDAKQKLNASNVSLAVIDMQISGQGVWTAAETSDYKLTGIRIAEFVRATYPRVKIGLLTGTRYEMPEVGHLDLAFSLKKPVDPADFEKAVKHALS